MILVGRKTCFSAKKRMGARISWKLSWALKISTKFGTQTACYASSNWYEKHYWKVNILSLFSSHRKWISCQCTYCYIHKTSLTHTELYQCQNKTLHEIHHHHHYYYWQWHTFGAITHTVMRSGMFCPLHFSKNLIDLTEKSVLGMKGMTHLLLKVTVWSILCSDIFGEMFLVDAAMHASPHLRLSIIFLL